MLAVALAVGAASLSPAPAWGGEMPDQVGVWVTSTAACFAPKTTARVEQRLEITEQDVALLRGLFSYVTGSDAAIGEVLGRQVGPASGPILGVSAAGSRSGHLVEIDDMEILAVDYSTPTGSSVRYLQAGDHPLVCSPSYRPLAN